MSNLLNSLSPIDKGDDMQRRLRYQAAYGALVCMDIFQDESFCELFCEHHEDFLIRRTNRSLIGVQVKTRDLHLGPFKSDERAVINALTRFVELDRKFPNTFGYFVLVANCDFWQAEMNEKNLPYVVKQLQENPKFRCRGTMKGVIAVIRKACKCRAIAVIDVLKKIRLDGRVPKYEDITGTLAARIGNLDEFKASYYPALLECARSLISRVLEASALTCDSPARTHYVFMQRPKDTATAKTIEDKKLTRGAIHDILKSFLGGGATLKTFSPLSVSNLPVGHHRVEQKMAAGEISFNSIALAKDHQASFEYMLQQWLHRYGDRIASSRLQQVDVLVRTQCAEAFDDVFSEQSSFGQAMLANVRSRLQRLAMDSTSVFGLRYEHLLGAVSVATQACRVWWSKQFDITEAS